MRVWSNPSPRRSKAFSGKGLDRIFRIVLISFGYSMYPNEMRPIRSIPPHRAVAIGELAERMREIENRSRGAARMTPTGWPELDLTLGGGLAGGAIHEWFGVSGDVPSRRWSPPVLILCHLLRQAGGATKPWCVWIGGRSWPTLHALVGEGGPYRSLLDRTLFVDADSQQERVWAIDLALRVPGLVVIADGSKLSMSATRRLQLAAEGGGSLGLLARPQQDRAELSAAFTRWEVTRMATSGESPRWNVHLSRCKGVPAISTRTVLLDLGDGGAVVPIPADVPLRFAPAAAAF